MLYPESGYLGACIFFRFFLIYFLGVLGRFLTGSEIFTGLDMPGRISSPAFELFNLAERAELLVLCEAILVSLVPLFAFNSCIGISRS
jgi:hypothetical protein